jgi:hypothetical protein
MKRFAGRSQNRRVEFAITAMLNATRRSKKEGGTKTNTFITK